MKTLKSLIFCLIVILGVSSFAKAAPSFQVPITILYVKQGGTGDCLDWDAACDLQTALSIASSGDQVWVAAGTYKPTDTADRFATFQLESGVAVYGGFPALGGTWEQRDWVANLTILSGDIGIDGDSSDNSYHAVTSSGVDVTAVLNGFTISGGNAKGGDPHYFGGGGMFNDSSSPTLTNVTFSGNSAYSGGGMYNDSSSPRLTSVTLSGNTADYYGGGMFNEIGSSPTLNGVTFTENSAELGGGMYNTNSHPTLTNVTFSTNSADYGGGGIYNASSGPTLANVTFSNMRPTRSVHRDGWLFYVVAAGNMNLCRW